jgi:outer membrane receptor for Fe3+-dicitrate
LGREETRVEARDEATADRLIEAVRRAVPGVQVIDLTGLADLDCRLRGIRP